MFWASTWAKDNFGVFWDMSLLGLSIFSLHLGSLGWRQAGVPGREGQAEARVEGRGGRGRAGAWGPMAGLWPGPGRGGSSDRSGHGLGSFRLEFGTTSFPITIMGLELVRGNPGIQSYGLPSEGLVSCRLGHQTFDKG